MSTGFFKHLPTIPYDFKSDGKFSLAKDLFRKVGIWSYLQEGVTGYSYYRIVDGERPDTVATRLYGDATLYWLFFLVNENLQDLNDWPKGQRQFEKYMDRKYSGTTLVASSSTDIVSYNHTTEVSSKFLLGEKVSQSDSVFGFVTNVDPTFNRITLNSVSGTFTSNSVITGQESNKSFTISSVVNERDAVNHYLNSNGFKTTDSTGNTAVTNFRHELNLNEDKFLIRYIEGKYVDKVIQEFKTLLRE